MQLKNSRYWVEHKPWIRVRDTLIILLIAFAIRYELQPLIKPYAPFHFFIVACIIVSVRYGYIAACTASAASTVIGLYFFVAPFSDLGLPTFSDVVITITFLVVTLSAIAVIEILQRIIYKQKLLIKVMNDQHRSSLFRLNELIFEIRNTQDKS